MVAWHYWHIGLLHDLLGLALAAHRYDCRSRRTDELDSMLLTFLGKTCVFREEAETRMKGITATSLCDLQDLSPVEVGLC